MTTDREYNGWTNRETWAVNLWLSNDEGIYSMAREVAAQDVDVRGGKLYPHEREDAVKDWVEDLLDPEGELGVWKEQAIMARDVGSIWRVNWTEIFESLTEE